MRVNIQFTAWNKQGLADEMAYTGSMPDPTRMTISCDVDLPELPEGFSLERVTINESWPREG